MGTKPRELGTYFTVGTSVTFSTADCSCPLTRVHERSTGTKPQELGTYFIVGTSVQDGRLFVVEHRDQTVKCSFPLCSVNGRRKTDALGSVCERKTVCSNSISRSIARSVETDARTVSRFLTSKTVKNRRKDSGDLSHEQYRTVARTETTLKTKTTPRQGNHALWTM